MEFLIELVLDLVFESGLLISTSRKVPAWVRYPLIVLIGLFFTAVIGIILLTGILMLQHSVLVGVLLIAIGVGLTFLTVRKFRRVYIEKREKWE